MEQRLLHIASRFAVEGSVISCTPHAGGNINHSYVAVTDSGMRYMLQRLSQAAFHDIPGLMQNVSAVCDFLRKKTTDPRGYLSVIRTKDGASFLRDDSGEYWRMLSFIEDSICLQTPQTPADLYESAVAIGQFLDRLSDFPAETLVETIPDFHHTPKRFAQFHAAIEKDPLGRRREVEDDIVFLLAHEEEGSLLQNLKDGGALPVRVTHNDAKLGNVLLDAQTKKALCVIDLDTVMPGLIAHDYGEAIRSGASTGEEDEHDTDKVSLRLDLVKVFTQGFIDHFPSMTKKEIETLPLGAKLMTLENAIRMLGDYILGDVYYTCSYPEQNLFRARTQIKLLREFDTYSDDLRSLICTFLQ